MISSPKSLNPKPTRPAEAYEYTDTRLVRSNASPLALFAAQESEESTSALFWVVEPSEGVWSWVVVLWRYAWSKKFQQQRLWWPWKAQHYTQMQLELYTYNLSGSLDQIEVL